MKKFIIRSLNIKGEILSLTNMWNGVNNEYSLVYIDEASKLVNIRAIYDIDDIIFIRQDQEIIELKGSLYHIKNDIKKLMETYYINSTISISDIMAGYSQNEINVLLIVIKK